ncbi:MAG: agmatinase [Sedimentisphaerales bacterium]|nr:agmatinase [Sedimentisphaerales bacterium]
MNKQWPGNAFLKIPEAYAQRQTARFVILPIAFDGTATYRKGCCRGPDAILEASSQIEDFDEQLADQFFAAGIYTHPHVAQGDETVEAVQEKIYAAARGVVDAAQIPIGLGGDHSVSLALIRAVRRRYPDLSVLHFDAHADLRASYHDSPLNHGCVMRRVHEWGIRAVSVGVRSYCREEFELIREQGLAIIGPDHLRRRPADSIRAILAALGEPVYITFDIDGLDPSIAPGTGTPEPGGLAYREALNVLENVGRNRTLVGADMVEVMPLPDQSVTEVTAARLVYKIIAFAQLAGRGPAAE